MEFPSKDTEEKIVLERIESTEIGIFRKYAGIIARQIHINHIRALYDLGLPRRICGLADSGYPLAGQFVDQGTFPGSRLPEQADLDFMIPFPLPDLQELRNNGFIVPGHGTASFIPAARWPSST